MDFLCAAMMHYEAAAAICALAAKGDKSYAKEGLRHCDQAIRICDRYKQSRGGFFSVKRHVYLYEDAHLQ